MTAPSIREAPKPHPGLKPCPFCGETRIFFNAPDKSTGFKGSINCPACGAEMPREVNSDQELIDCWNARAATDYATAILASGLVTENKNWKTSPEILLDQIAALRDEYQRLRRDCLDQLEWHAGQGNSEDAGEFSTEAERHAAALLACNRILKLVSNFKA